MDLDHDKMSPEEAARELKVRINDVPWQAHKISIVRRERKGPHWVYMVVADEESGMQYTYFMERLPMIKAWLALDAGSLGREHINDLAIELDGDNLKVLDVKTSQEGGEQWIHLEISRINGVNQVVSIERQSMINAYYALRLGVEDMIETAMGIAESFLKDL